jgi:hypothetical protein
MSSLHAKFGGVWSNNEGGGVKYTGFRQSQILIYHVFKKKNSKKIQIFSNFFGN